jgi:hypothetical protein
MAAADVATADASNTSMVERNMISLRGRVTGRCWGRVSAICKRISAPLTVS